MTNQEFSDQFDVLYNNITSNQAPGLNEYEKSVFLTKAQDELVKNHMNANNQLQQGYDQGFKRQVDFSNLMRVCEAPPYQGNYMKFDIRSTAYLIPNSEKVFICVNEMIETADNHRRLQVIPIAYDTYTRLMSKPYKYPNKNQAWKLHTSYSEANGKIVEILLPSDIDKTLQSTYSIRYIKRPRPIRLINFTDEYDNVTLDGNTAQTCELDESLHYEILQRAVELAKIAWSGDLSAELASGQRSE